MRQVEMQLRTAIVLLGAFLAGCQTRGVATRAAIEPDTATAADGLEVAYDVRGTGDSVLVFVHGWACDRTFWLQQLDTFAEDHQVVAVDLGGHGKSGKEREDWSLETLAGDVIAVVDELGLERFVLVGHSMGGPVSLIVARRLPGRVVGVVGVDTLHDAEREYSEVEIQAQLAAFESQFLPTMTAAVTGMFADGANPEVVEWTVAKARGVDQEAVLSIVRTLPGYEPGPALADAGVPIRCINAAPRPPRVMETRTEANQRYADFDVVLMEGVGHFPMLEAPERFNEHLEAILDELQGPPAE